MRTRLFLVFGLVAMAAAGSWRLWGHAGGGLSPWAWSDARARAGVAVTGPTAVDEGDLLLTTGAARGPRSLPDAHRHRDIRSAHARSVASPPQRTSRDSAATSSAPVDRPEESPRQASSTSPHSAPPSRPGSEGRAEPSPSPSGAVAATSPIEESPVVESGGAGGQGLAQDATGPASLGATAAGRDGVSPSGAPPRLVAPRVIDAAGTEYPGEAFRLTLRRQDLGPVLVVEGAEGTVALRALISADGSVRTVGVATSSGSPVLDRAAADAVRRWRFTPATRDGVPIDAYAILRIRYVVR